MFKYAEKKIGSSTNAIVQQKDISACRKNRDMLRKHNSELLAIQQITAVASKSLNLDDTYNTIMDKLQHVMGIDVCGIQLFDESCEWLFLKAHRGISKKYAQAIEKVKVADDAMAQHILSTGRPKIVIDRKKQSEPRKKQADGENLGSFVIVPLRAGRKILGELVIQNYRGHELPIEDINIWISIGNTIGIAIINARLYESVQHELLERKKAEKERKKINIQLQDRVDELERVHTFVIDRELKMIELKNKIKELQKAKKQ